MTEPPEDSTAVVSWETAVPLAGTSSLTVIEYETLGAVAMAESFAFLGAGRRAGVAGPGFIATRVRSPGRPDSGHAFRYSHLPTSSR
ncbi:hypothetical protein JCM13580A_41470 [Streptomyces drozdowiczii]